MRASCRRSTSSTLQPWPRLGSASDSWQLLRVDNLRAGGSRGLIITEGQGPVKNMSEKEG